MKEGILAVRKSVVTTDKWETMTCSTYAYSDTEVEAYIKAKEIMMNHIKDVVDAIKEIDIKIKELSNESKN